MAEVENDSGTEPDTDGQYDDVVDYDPASPVQPFAMGGAGISVLDTFRQELGELTAAESVLIPVKGYEQTGLQIKYRMPASGQELERISSVVSRRYKSAYERSFYVALDTMVYLCEGLFVQPEGVEEPVMLDPEETGEPCQFDDRLATMMGIYNGDGSQSPTPRTVVRRLFGGNEMAILNHAERLNRWLANTKADLNAEIWQLGE
jgi:hypothetical protein